MVKQHLKPSQWKATVTACLLAVGGAMPAAHADLTLNFAPVSGGQALLGCMPGVAFIPGSCVRMQNTQDPDTTPFYMEAVTDAATGVSYYHTLLGDTNSDFAQEYYIAYAGNASWWPGFRMNASAGTYNGGADAQPTQNWTATFHDPLAASNLSGNGTGRPDRVMFRQTIKGTGFNQEVLKANRLNKPKITPPTTDGEMASDFVLDMSTLVYDGASALTNAGAITNTLVVTDSQSGQIMANFDINTTSQNSNVTGGKYNYTPGTGTGGSFGAYTYATGSFDVYSVNWSAFWDPTANIPNY
jgi:hypothetical protein